MTETQRRETIDNIVLDHVADAVTSRGMTFAAASGLVSTWDEMRRDARRGRIWRALSDAFVLGPIRRVLGRRGRA